MKNTRLKEKAAKKAIKNLVNASAILDKAGLPDHSFRALKIISSIDGDGEDDGNGPVLYTRRKYPIDSDEKERLEIARKINGLKESAHEEDISGKFTRDLFNFLEKLTEFLGL
jgi:hypothetical protein